MNHRHLIPILGLLVLCGTAAAQQGTHTVRGKVWRDFNVDGLRGVEEATLGVEGKEVQLWDSTGTTMIQFTETDANGDYEFSILLTGPLAYRVRIKPDITRFPNIGPKNVGENTLIDNDFNPSGEFKWFTDILVGVPHVPRTAIDAGLDPVDIRVGDRTWLDLDGDGRQDAGEPGLPGIAVEIWNSQRTVRYDSTVSDDQGAYIVRAPGYGSFRAYFSLPALAERTSMNVGSDDAIDSDVIPSGNQAGWTNTFTFASNILAYFRIDAGYTYENPADVALEYVNVPALVYPDSLVGWTLWVRESLQRSVGSVRIRAAVPVGMTQFTWQCTAQGSATCPAGGSGALDLTQYLPASGALRIDFSARAGMQPSQFVATASAEVALPQIEVRPADNDVLVVINNDYLFRGSFDPGG